MKMKMLIAFCLIACTVLGLCSCSSSPSTSLEDSLQKGYEMFNPAGESAREFKISITQGANYKYTITGYTQNGKAVASVLVSRNDMPNNYKNAFIIDGETLYINLNAAMSATEEELGFLFNNTRELQGKTLVIPKGAVKAQEYISYIASLYANDIKTSREQQKNNGEETYEFSYDTEALKTLFEALVASADKTQPDNAKKIEEILTSLGGDYYEMVERTAAYLTDCIDIDTDEIIKEPESIATHFASLIPQELKALQKITSTDGSTVTETIEYSSGDRESATFKHEIKIKDKDGNVYGSIAMEAKEVDGIPTIITNDADAKDTLPDIQVKDNAKIEIKDFVPLLLENAKIFKGVGYESSDFPYEATYTNDALTIIEKTDAFTATHLFTFFNSSINQYTVVYDTYDYPLHLAIAQRLETLGYTINTNATYALQEGTGSGKIEAYSERPQYSAKDPIQLLEILTTEGLPLYGY